jgi:hypothetical protein
MQILDHFFLQPLEIYYAKKEMRIKNNPNIVVTNYRIIGLFGKAYLKSATAGIAA